MKYLTRCIASLALLLPLAALADGLTYAKQTIFGMDCAPCAYGIEKGLGELDGVESVTVSLNDGYAEIGFSADGGSSVEAIRNVIRNSGFSPREATVRVTGELVLAGDGAAALQSGSQRYTLESNDPDLLVALRQRAGQRVEVSGTVARDASRTLWVTAIRE